MFFSIKKLHSIIHLCHLLQPSSERRHVEDQVPRNRIPLALRFFCLPLSFLYQLDYINSQFVRQLGKMNDHLAKRMMESKIYRVNEQSGDRQERKQKRVSILVSFSILMTHLCCIQPALLNIMDCILSTAGRRSSHRYLFIGSELNICCERLGVIIFAAENFGSSFSRISSSMCCEDLFPKLYFHLVKNLVVDQYIVALTDCIKIDNQYISK